MQKLPFAVFLAPKERFARYRQVVTPWFGLGPERARSGPGEKVAARRGGDLWGQTVVKKGREGAERDTWRELDEKVEKGAFLLL